MLAARNRLKLTKDFKEVTKRGKMIVSPLLNFKWKQNDLDFPRFGFVVSLTISKKATVRNKIKRQLREIVRLLIKDGRIEKGVDGVFYTKKSIIESNYQDLEKATVDILRKSRNIK